MGYWENNWAKAGSFCCLLVDREGCSTVPPWRKKKKAFSKQKHSTFRDAWEMSRIALVVFDLTRTHRVSANTYQEINTSLNYTLILHIISGCNVNKDSIPLWSFGLHFIEWRIYPSHFILFVWYQKITCATFGLYKFKQNPCNCIDLTTQIIYSNRSQPGSYRLRHV